MYYNNQYFDNYKNKNIEPFDYFTCTLNLDNVIPNFADNYMKFDNQHVSCGVCKNATLKVNINKCPVDEYGSPISYCKQTSSLTSSLGNPLTFPLDVTPQNVSSFFCIS